MKSLIIGFLILIQWFNLTPVYAEINLPIYESFDEQELPPGWSGEVEYLDSAWQILDTSYAGGEPYELNLGNYHFWYGGRYISAPPINVSGISEVRIRFRHHFIKNSTYYNAVGIAYGSTPGYFNWMEINEEWEYIVVGHSGSEGTSIPPEVYEVIIPSPGDVLYLAWFGWVMPPESNDYEWFYCSWYVDDIQITNPESSPEVDAVYRFFNTVRGGHLYTVSDIERDYIFENLPEWTYEGISFGVYLEETEGTVSSYRFFNTNTGIHLYTTSEYERDHIIDNLPEWNYEGVSFYVYPASEGDTIPVFRFFNTLLGGHLYTISEIERDHIMDNLPEWNYEGISFYVYPHEEVTDTSLPKTGQTISYWYGDDGYHQMGVQWPEPRFTDHGNGTVTDNLTGLMWTQKFDLADGELNWNDAIEFCNDLDHGGYTDWRLPNVRELHSLIDISESGPALPDGHPFTNIVAGSHWSSTTYADNTENAWNVRISYEGRRMNTSKTNNLYVWAVRGTSHGLIQVHRTGQTISYRDGDDGYYQMGAEWPSPRFTDHEDGTVTDNLTGLMWTKDANMDGTKYWWDALDYCNALDHGGYTDWRLPNVQELQSFADYGQTDLAFPSEHPFVGIQSHFYWSSSTNIRDTLERWCVFMPYGMVMEVLQAVDYFVWPVRAGN